MDIFGNNTDYKLQRGMLKATSPTPLDKGQNPRSPMIVSTEWSYAREGNPQAPEHEMGISDPTQTTGHQNSNAGNDRNGTCSVA